MRLRIHAILLLFMTLQGCGREADPVLTPVAPDAPVSPDSILTAQCGLLSEAVESFAALRDGAWPLDLEADSLETGETVLDLMPLGGRYTNPYTGIETVPSTCRAASPGEIGYEPVIVEERQVGYLVTAFGETGTVVSLSNLACDEESEVLANCIRLAGYLEMRMEMQRQWIEDLGLDRSLYYPSDWYRFASELDLVNPFTGTPTPVRRTADRRGESGYVCIRRNGWNEGYVITGYGEGSFLFAESNLSSSMNDAIVIANCRTLQTALEWYMEKTDGAYPGNLSSDRNLEGKTVIEYLCGSTGLMNPFTGIRSEPFEGAAGLPGAVGYEAIAGDGFNIGYRITGFGATVLVMELTNLESSEEETVVRNCHILRDAVELFAGRNGGIYPVDLDTDRNAYGETVIDLLPRGHMLMNPYTHVADNPRNHSASLDGQVGYARIALEDRYDGYVVTGFAGGEYELALTNLACVQKEAIVLSNCRTVQLAAEAWAQTTGGMYPSTTNSDCNYEGNTVVDLLPGGVLLINPFTLARTEPIDACSANPGEIGYVPVCATGLNVGYCITGTGRMAGYLIGTLCAYPDSESPRR